KYASFNKEENNMVINSHKDTLTQLSIECIAKENL
ncbi:glycosyl transferase family 2, partial [Priestia megaterium]